MKTLVDKSCPIKDESKNKLLSSLRCTASAENRSRPADHLLSPSVTIPITNTYLISSYCEDNGTAKANSRADDFTVTRILIRSCIWQSVINPGNLERKDTQHSPHWKQTKGIGKKSHMFDRRVRLTGGAE